MMPTRIPTTRRVRPGRGSAAVRGSATALAVAVAAIALAVASCGGPAGDSASVLLVTIDTLRPDHVGVYGHPNARTPHLDALARTGALFTDARVPYPLTLPSHASLLTGQLPYRHGARRNDSFALDPGLPTIAGVFGEAGHATAGVVATLVLNRSFGLARTFGTYHDLSAPADMKRGKHQRRADEVTDLARVWITDRPDSALFLWAHYFDPHDDYEPPRPFDTIYAGSESDLYDGEIAYTDRELGRLLQRLELRDDGRPRLTIVTSDHGEAFGEHGEYGHGYFLYDTTVCVPLILARPSAPAPGRIHRGLVSSLDVFPTVCRLADVPAPRGLPGRFLDPFGDGPGEEVPLYLETFEPTVAYGATDLRAVVAGDRKWIEAPTPELYDLTADPHELENLEGTEPAREEALRAALAVHLDAERAASRSAGADAGVDEDTRSRLLALGYLTSGADEEAAGWARRDPKDIVHLLPRMFEGVKLCRNDRWEEGVAILETVLAEDPINGKALHWLSRDRMRTGDADGAAALYRSALERDPANPALLNSLGLVYLQAKRPREALPAFETAVAVDPRHVSGWLNLASVHARLKETDAAAEAVRHALAIDPTNPMAQQMAQRLGITEPGDDPARR